MNMLTRVALVATAALSVTAHAEPLTLEDTIARALATTPQAEANKARLAALRAARGQAGLKPNPSVEVFGENFDRRSECEDEQSRKPPRKARLLLHRPERALIWLSESIEACACPLFYPKAVLRVSYECRMLGPPRLNGALNQPRRMPCMLSQRMKGWEL